MLHVHSITLHKSSEDSLVTWNLIGFPTYILVYDKLICNSMGKSQYCSVLYYDSLLFLGLHDSTTLFLVSFILDLLQYDLVSTMTHIYMCMSHPHIMTHLF